VVPGRVDTPAVAWSKSDELATIGMRIAAAVESVRAQAVSLHDAKGVTLWLTDSSMGADAHAAALQGAAVFAHEDSAPILTIDLDAARSVVLIRAIDVQGSFVGLVALIVSISQWHSGGADLARSITPEFRQALADFSAVRCRSSQFASEMTVGGKPSAKVDSAIQELARALRSTPITLYAQRMVPLAALGGWYCFDVLAKLDAVGAPRSVPPVILKAAIDHGLGSVIDRRVVTHLCEWLKRHRTEWAETNPLWIIHLSRATVHQPAFVEFVQSLVVDRELPAEVLGLKIDAARVDTSSETVFDVAESLQQMGCSLILDNFQLTTECIDLLHLPGIKMLKIASYLTTRMRSDKHAQASISAICRMAKQIGIHSGVQHSEGDWAQPLLAKLGVDFAQSNALSAPIAISELRQ
jgi:EAL domain-containing protein (putative c-di-GMP-specific phosphodiesterase class I)